MHLYITNLPTTATPDTLRHLFARYGGVVRVDLSADEDTGESRGWAFLEMGEATAARRAIAGLHGTMLDGQVIAVMKAYPQRERPPRREAPRLWP